MYIIVRDTDQVVTDAYTEPLPVPAGSTQYDVSGELPTCEQGEILKYDGTTYIIDPNSAERRTEMEPQLLALYRKWQDAKAIGLSCEPHCKAEYDAAKAAYDAL
tara:strand:- start:1100 stop:1411 length:312 start_codon:yes stop_codon:yes gene_type:complete